MRHDKVGSVMTTDVVRAEYATPFKELARRLRGPPDQRTAGGGRAGQGHRRPVRNGPDAASGGRARPLRATAPHRVPRADARRQAAGREGERPHSRTAS